MWFKFNQNNSGGKFTYSKNLADHVWIEADNPRHANIIAEDLGIYFDGCDTGRDCPCCGDRWYPVYGTGSDITLDQLLEKLRNANKEYKNSLYNISWVVHAKGGAKYSGGTKWGTEIDFDHTKEER
jgi:hypothetical protein